ncbi:uncharacterized protein [Dermacentor andersoni]|uniref:uncharacterized protein isoform X1 n=1 Tax=Dermacentor andersoni TaxID=34620 RepID=UPI003B3BAECF
MFYAHFVLAKKGPLARIWLAAHWDKKLTKAHVFETNIESSVEGILQPKVKMALRTSGHLLLGIVRIYSRKAKYLLADCNEAFIKIKMAFRPGAVDLPEEGRQAALSTITLPEVFHDFEATMPDLSNIDMEAAVTLNQSRAEDITLKEDYGSLSLINDDNFGDMGFDDPEMAREATNIDEAFDQASLLLGGSMLGRPSEVPRGPSASADIEVGASSTAAENSALGAMPVPGESIEAGRNAREGEADPFGAAAASTETEVAEDAREGTLLEGEPSGLFEPAGLFDDAPLGHVPLDTSGSDRDGPLGAPGPAPAVPDARPVDESDDDDDMYDMGPPSMGAPSGPSSPGSSVGDARDLDGGATTSAAAGAAGPSSSSAMPGVDEGLLDQQQQDEAAMPPPPQPPSVDSAQMGGVDAGPGEQTTLLNNEDESFALAPLDTIVQGVEKARAKRKRKLIVDEVKNISGEEMKSQLSDTSDIVTTLDLAPPTKRLMHWKETGGVEKLFALPGRPILSKALSRLYQRHLTTRSVENELAAGEEHLLQQLEDEQDTIVEQPQQMPQHEDHMQENSLGHHTKRRRLEDDLVGPHAAGNEQPAHHYDLGAPDFPHGGPPSHLGPPSVDPYASVAVASMVPPHQQEYQQPQPQTPLQDGWPTPADYTYAQPPPPPHTPVPDYAAAYQMQQQQQQVAMMGHHPMTPLHHPHLQQQLTPAPHLEEEHHQHHPGHHQAAAALFPTLQPDQLQSEYPVHPATPVPTPQSPPAAMMPPTAQMGPPPTPQMMHPPTPQMQHQQEETPSMEPLAPPSEFDALVASGPALHGFGGPMESTSAEQHHLEEPEPESEPQMEPHASTEDQQQQQQQEQQQQQQQDRLMEQEQQQQDQLTEQQQQDQLTEQQQQDQLAQLDDDDEDYGPPASVGPAEEQLADETYEQFEERILNKRTVHMLHMIRTPLEAGRQVRFSDIARGSNRKQVAQKFYTFLVLKKQQAVELRQESAFAELYIEKGPKFEQSL